MLSNSKEITEIVKVRAAKLACASFVMTRMQRFREVCPVFSFIVIGLGVEFAAVCVA